MNGAYSPIEVAIALSLYSYNTPPDTRANRLYQHFNGNCMEISEMLEILVCRGAFAATEFPFPTACVYVKHALEKYGEEARERASVNPFGSL